MKIELLTKGNIENLFSKANISYNITYAGENYKVVEIEKGDMESLSTFILEGDNSWCSWWYYSKGARTGSACEFFRINGCDIIGWGGKKDNYKTLLDYFSDELNVTMPEDICDYAVSLAKVNGMTMGKLFGVCEG